MFDQGLLAKQEEHPRIGIIGGTFDPVHYAHLAIAEEVYQALGLAKMLFVPAGQPPHKVGYRVTPVEHRVAMLEQAIAANPHFTLSLVDVQRPGPSYTVDMLRLLRQAWGPLAEFYFVIGGDSLKDLPDWYDSAGVIAQATIVALTRPGYSAATQAHEQLIARLPDLQQRLITLEGPRMDISATDLRRRVADGRPIKYQTPEVVEDYIFRQRLYQNDAAGQSFKHTQEDTHATNAV